MFQIYLKNVKYFENFKYFASRRMRWFLALQLKKTQQKPKTKTKNNQQQHFFPQAATLHCFMIKRKLSPK